jgi:hypothetical protein
MCPRSMYTPFHIFIFTGIWQPNACPTNVRGVKLIASSNSKLGVFGCISVFALVGSTCVTVGGNDGANMGGVPVIVSTSEFIWTVFAHVFCVLPDDRAALGWSLGPIF